jgi:hypothetical protein
VIVGFVSWSTTSPLPHSSLPASLAVAGDGKGIWR